MADSLYVRVAAAIRFNTLLPAIRLCTSATLAVEVPDFAQHDRRLAQNILPAVETLMAVTYRGSFWQAIVDMLLCIGVPDILRAVVAKVTGHGGHREDRPSWASRIAATVPRPDETVPRTRARNRGNRRRGSGWRNEDDDSDLSSDYGRRSPSPSTRRDRPDRSRPASPGPRRG